MSSSHAFLSDEAQSDGYPGLRYLAPAGRPTVISTRSREAAAVAGIAFRLDRASALNLLAFEEYPIERSFLENVAVAAPRVPVRRDANGVLLQHELLAPPPCEVDEADAARRLRDVLDAAVESTLTPARRVAVALSGGLDSSVVAASACAALQRLGRSSDDLLLFHILPRFGPTEVEHARSVARRLGRPLLEIPWPDGDPFEGLETLLEVADSPFDALGVRISLEIRRRIKAEGADTLLTGHGGDETVGAYRQVVVDVRRPVPGRALRLYRGARALARPLYARFAPWVVKNWRRRLPGWLSVRLRGASPLASSPSVRSGLEGAAMDRDRGMRSSRQCAIVAWETMLDRATGIRSGFPFLDPAVEDFVLSIPQSHFAAGGRQKGLMRRAFADVLPPAEARRPKNQPRIEPMIYEDVRRYGDAWVERYLASGTLEALDLLPRREAGRVIAAAQHGSLAELHRASSLVWLSAWADVRPARGIGVGVVRVPDRGVRGGLGAGG